MTWRELITKLGFNVDTSGLATYDKAIQGIQDKTEGMYRGLNKFADGMVNLGTKLSLSLSLPLTTLGTVSVMASAKIEQVRTTFDVMLGDAAKTESLMQDLFNFEAKTPFNLEDVLGFSNTLVMMREPLDQITNRMTMLGEATGGKAEAMNAVLAQLFQVKNLGYASMQDIKPITNWGVPIIEALSKVMNTDAKGVMQGISKQQITYDILMKAFEKIGQDRAGLMQRQSQTITGLMSTIQSGIFKLRMELGDLIVKELKLQKVMKKIIEYLDKTVQWVKTLNPSVKKLVLILGLFAIAIGPILVGLGLILKSVIALAVLPALFSMFLPIIIQASIALGIMLLKLAAIAAIAALLVLVIDDIVGFFMGKDSFIIPAWKKIFGDLMTWLSGTWYGRWGDFLWSLVEKWKSGATAIADWWRNTWEGFFSWYTNNPVVKAMMSVGGWMAKQQREVRSSNPYGNMWNTPQSGTTIQVSVGSLSVPVTGGMGVPWKAELMQNAKGVIEAGILDQIKNALTTDLQTATRR